MKVINVIKQNYSGNGFTNNIGYTIVGDSATFYIPALNNTNQYDEAYNAFTLDQGLHLQNEALSFIDNVFTNGNNTLESILDYNYECDNSNVIVIDATDEDYANASE